MTDTPPVVRFRRDEAERLLNELGHTSTRSRARFLQLSPATVSRLFRKDGRPSPYRISADTIAKFHAVMPAHAPRLFDFNGKARKS